MQCGDLVHAIQLFDHMKRDDNLTTAQLNRSPQGDSRYRISRDTTQL